MRRKVKITEECIMCNLCCEELPEVFENTGDKIVVLSGDDDRIDESLEGEVEICMGLCPVAAIQWEE